MKNKCLEKITISQKISISPEYSNKLKKKVYEYMDTKLLKWDNKIKGLLLNYSNLKITKPYVEYTTDVTMHVPVIYDAIYFVPKENECFYGEITNISDDKINFQIFNNILGIIFLAGVDFSYNISTIDESQKILNINHKNKHYKLEVGSQIKIRLNRYYNKLEGDVFLLAELEL